MCKSRLFSFAVAALMLPSSVLGSDGPLLSIAGRTELPDSFRFRVDYFARNDSWLCTRYSFGVGERLAKRVTHYHDATISDGEYRAEVPLDEEDPNTRCGWWPRQIWVCVADACSGIASMEEASVLATPLASTFRCERGERSGGWMCVGADSPSRDPKRASSRLGIDLLRSPRLDGSSGPLSAGEP
jgi:hypothetical protein